MASLARQGIDSAYGVATGILSKCDSSNLPGCIRAFDDFLRSKFVYRGERDEVLREVPFMVNDLQTKGNMEGDCDDMCIMSCSLFLSAGILTRMTAIRSVPDEFDHVFSEAFDGSQWVPVDPTVPYGQVYRHYGITFQAV